VEDDPEAESTVGVDGCETVNESQAVINIEKIKRQVIIFFM
jgi:hypothetical protein